MENRVLMIAYHYPPNRGSSGSLRTLNFTRHLPRYGWNPALLTVHARAYPETSADQCADIPAGMPLHRAFALDASRHLALSGRYPGWIALPDRWISWIVAGVPAGMSMISKYRPRVIWSTYPIATALWIGYLLHRLSGLPWVTDFRDPLTEVDPRTGQRHPPGKSLWRARRAIEQHAVEHSARTVLVTPGARRIYAERYERVPDSHWAVIPNGYEEETFAAVEPLVHRPPLAGRPIQLLHSGFLYPTPDRDPTAFFMALSSLKASGKISPSQVNVTLRASGFDEHYRDLIRQHELEDMVRLVPAVSYRDALKEMLSADGLLVFQGYTSNPAVPAKLYEYLRARRPILAMVDADGDTAATLRSAGAGIIIPLEFSEQIAYALLQFLGQIQEGTTPTANESIVRSFARESRAADLATLFDRVVLDANKKSTRAKK